MATLVLDPADALSGHVYENTLTAVVWLVLGGLLVSKGIVNPFGVLFLVVGASSAFAVACGAFAGLADSHAMAGAVPAAWLAGWVWTAGTFIPITLLPLWFPDGGAPGRRWRIAGVVSVVGIALVTVAGGLEDRIQVTYVRSVPNPLAAPVAEPLFLAGAVLIAAGAVTGMVALFRRMVAATGERRRQIAPVVVAVVVAVPALLVAAALPEWGPLIQVVTMPLLPAAIVLAVLRYRLYDLEIVVRRAVVYGGLTALVVGGYALVVAATAGLLHRQAGLPESLLATGVVALAFQPAREALQSAVGHWLYGERDAPHRALAAVGEQLTGVADPEVALQRAVAQVQAALRLPWVGVNTRTGGRVASGVQPSWVSDEYVAHVPLVHLGVRCGEMLVAQRSARDHLSAGDRRLLEQLAVPVAAVVSAKLLIVDLRRSREQVVLAREEERRRLRRDLHDGLGPLLSAIVVQADVASIRLQRDGGGAEDLVDRVRKTAGDAIAGLRLVVEGLRPAAVDDLGLDGALGELAAAMSVSGGASVQLRGGRLPSLPAAVELAAYRIASEAVTNAIRHGGAAHVELSVAAPDSTLHLTVDDDGSGFVPDAACAGLGLHSMRERAEELGGRLELASGSHGTHIEASLPLRLGGTACG